MIALTETATTKVKELLDAEGQPELFLRVAVRPGGCSGFSYEMFFDSERADDDIAEAYGDVTVVVDPASAQYLSGASLDYKDGLQGAGFAIDNPNAQRTCGCGQSFKTADDLRAAARRCPDEKLLVETDSPYLAPVPFRGKTNQPAYVAHVAAALAEALGRDLGEVAELTDRNAAIAFRLPVP